MVPRYPKSSLGREVWWLVVQRDRDGAGEQGVQARNPTTRSRPEASLQRTLRVGLGVLKLDTEGT